MKIGIDATPLSVPRAGVGTYTANLIRALRETGGDEVVPLLHRDLHAAFAEEFGLSTGFHGARGLPRHLNRTVWMQTALRRRIHTEGFDVCHFTNSVAPLGCGCPYVVTIHDAGLWLHPEYHYLRRLLALRPLIPHSVRRAAAVVTVSHSVKEELIEVLRLPASRIRVIPQGVSPSFAATPSPAELERVRELHGLPDRFVLVVGALEPRKNLVRLLEAYLAVAAEPAGRGVGLVLVGPAGWKNQPIRDAVSRLRRHHPIFLLEPVPTEALVALYHLAAVLAFPSLYEGFGLPLVEAMTCGTPVVTSGSGALAEIAGDAAELVNPRRVESIADGLCRVLADRERAADLRARGLVRARDFSWRRAARETRSLYAEIAGETPALPAPPAARERRRLASLHHGGEALPAAPTQPLEKAIIHAVGYADLFDYPLTAGELHRYLIGVRADASEVEEALADGRLVPGRLAHREGLFSLPGREAVMELRQARRAPAEDLWRWAIHFGRHIAALPFVRMVAVTGSLAASNVDAEADVDYLIVTAPGRLWTCRALVVSVVRRAARRGIALCPNFLLSEAALELRQRDLYTAWELAQMVPISGLDTYHLLRQSNRWSEAFLPNAAGVPWQPEPEEGAEGPAPVRTRLTRTAEVVLGSRTGDWLEGWERTRKVRRLTREAAIGGNPQGEAEFSADWCKGHLGTHREDVMARYRHRLEELAI